MRPRRTRHETNSTYVPGRALANVAVGYGVAVATQIVVFPYFWLEITVAENLTIGAIFTMVSVVRSYSLRRMFEAIRVWY